MDRTHDPFLNRAKWNLAFAWVPHRCYISNKWVWFDLGYQGTAVWTGPGDPVTEIKWLTKEEYLIGLLKGKI